eukprot:445819-Rhodomonas_salina.1
MLSTLQHGKWEQKSLEISPDAQHKSAERHDEKALLLPLLQSVARLDSKLFVIILPSARRERGRGERAAEERERKFVSSPRARSSPRVRDCCSSCLASSKNCWKSAQYCTVKKCQRKDT